MHIWSLLILRLTRRWVVICISEILQLTPLIVLGFKVSDVVDEASVFGSSVHPGIVVDLLVFESVGNNQLVFYADG